MCVWGVQISGLSHYSPSWNYSPHYGIVTMIGVYRLVLVVVQASGIIITNGLQPSVNFNESQCVFDFSNGVA